MHEKLGPTGGQSYSPNEAAAGRPTWCYGRRARAVSPHLRPRSPYPCDFERQSGGTDTAPPICEFKHWRREPAARKSNLKVVGFLDGSVQLYRWRQPPDSCRPSAMSKRCRPPTRPREMNYGAHGGEKSHRHVATSRISAERRHKHRRATIVRSDPSPSSLFPHRGAIRRQSLASRLACCSLLLIWDNAAARRPTYALIRGAMDQPRSTAPHVRNISGAASSAAARERGDKRGRGAPAQSHRAYGRRSSTFAAFLTDANRRSLHGIRQPPDCRHSRRLPLSVGIEIDAGHFETARKRIEAELRQPTCSLMRLPVLMSLAMSKEGRNRFGASDGRTTYLFDRGRRTSIWNAVAVHVARARASTAPPTWSYSVGRQTGARLPGICEAEGLVSRRRYFLIMIFTRPMAHARKPLRESAR